MLNNCFTQNTIPTIWMISKIIAILPRFKKNLHWLKFQDRITYKILMLTYKSYYNIALTYLCELIAGEKVLLIRDWDPIITNLLCHQLVRIVQTLFLSVHSFMPEPEPLTLDLSTAYDTVNYRLLMSRLWASRPNIPLLESMIKLPERCRHLPEGKLAFDLCSKVNSHTLQPGHTPVPDASRYYS